MFFSDNDLTMFRIMTYIYSVQFDSDPAMFRMLVYLLILITCLVASFKNDLNCVFR